MLFYDIIPMVATVDTSLKGLHRDPIIEALIRRLELVEEKLRTLKNDRSVEPDSCSICGRKSLRYINE